MRSNSGTVGQTKPSFIEVARREQIVETAIRIIAEQGFPRTSLAEIAREVGCSKGVISYHFEGKSELVQAVLERLLSEPSRFIKPRVEACESAMEKIQAYIQANFDLMKAQRNYYVALVEMWGSRVSTGGRNHFDAEAYEPSRRYLSKILEAGRESGELRHVALPTMASVIQAAIDGVMLQWVFDPNAIDLDACGREISEMIQRHLADDAVDPVPIYPRPVPDTKS